MIQCIEQAKHLHLGTKSLSRRGQETGYVFIQCQHTYLIKLEAKESEVRVFYSSLGKKIIHITFTEFLLNIARMQNFSKGQNLMHKIANTVLMPLTVVQQQDSFS